MNQKKAKKLRRLAQKIADNQQDLPGVTGGRVRFDPAHRNAAGRALYRALKAGARQQ